MAITLAVPCRVQGAVANLSPTADAFVTTGSATNNLSLNNYGSAGALAVSASGLSKGEFQSVLRFNMSAALSAFNGIYGAGLWTLQSVTLQLTAASPNNAIFNASSAGSFGVSWMQNDGWTEGTGTPNIPQTTGITYSSLQATFINSFADESLGTFSFSGATNGTFLYSLNLSPGLMADLLAGDNLSLRLFAADSVLSYFSDSQNFGTAGLRPFLNVTAVPEPGTVTLLALGGLLCVVRGVARRRH
jgi:hypothetical protein